MVFKVPRFTSDASHIELVNAEIQVTVLEYVVHVRRNQRS